METEQTLNRLLVQFFKFIMEIEEKKLITDEFKNITYNDMHVIEAIGLKEPQKMSQIAKLLSVTTGTLTKAMDSLEKKGYVLRQRSDRDKRVVYGTRNTGLQASRKISQRNDNIYSGTYQRTGEPGAAEGIRKTDDVFSAKVYCVTRQTMNLRYEDMVPQKRLSLLPQVFSHI